MAEIICQRCQEAPNYELIEMINLTQKLLKQILHKCNNRVCIIVNIIKKVLPFDFAQYIEVLESPIYQQTMLQSDEKSKKELDKQFNALYQGTNLASHYISAQSIANQEERESQLKNITRLIQNKVCSQHSQDNGQLKSPTEKISLELILVIIKELFRQATIEQTQFKRCETRYKHQQQVKKTIYFLKFYSSFAGTRNLFITNAHYQINNVFKQIKQHRDAKQQNVGDNSCKSLKQSILDALQNIFEKSSPAKQYAILQIYRIVKLAGSKFIENLLPENLRKEEINKYIKEIPFFDQITSVKQLQAQTKFLIHADVMNLNINIQYNDIKALKDNEKLQNDIFTKSEHRLTTFVCKLNMLPVEMLMIQYDDTQEKKNSFIIAQRTGINNNNNQNDEDNRRYSSDIKRKIEKLANKSATNSNMKCNVILQTYQILPKVQDISLHTLIYHNFSQYNVTLELKYPERLVSASLTKVTISNLGKCIRLQNLYLEKCEINQSEFNKLQSIVRIYINQCKYNLSQQQNVAQSFLLKDIFENKQLQKVIQFISINCGENTVQQYLVQQDKKAEPLFRQLRCLDLSFEQKRIENIITLEYSHFPMMDYASVHNGVIYSESPAKTLQSMEVSDYLNQEAKQYLKTISTNEQFDIIKEMRKNTENIQSNELSKKYSLIGKLLDQYNVFLNKYSESNKKWKKSSNRQKQQDEQTLSESQTSQQELLHSQQQYNFEKTILNSDSEEAKRNLIMVQIQVIRLLILAIAQESDEQINQNFSGIDIESISSAISQIMSQMESNGYLIDAEQDNFNIVQAVFALSNYQKFAQLKIHIANSNKLEKIFNLETLYKRLESRVQIIDFQTSILFIKYVDQTTNKEVIKHLIQKQLYTQNNIDNFFNDIQQNFENKNKNAGTVDVIFVYSATTTRNDMLPIINSKLQTLPIRYLNYWQNWVGKRPILNLSLTLKKPNVLINASLNGIVITNIDQCVNLKNLAMTEADLMKHLNIQPHDSKKIGFPTQFKVLDKLWIEFLEGDECNKDNSFQLQCFLNNLIQNNKLKYLYFNSNDKTRRFIKLEQISNKLQIIISAIKAEDFQSLHYIFNIEEIKNNIKNAQTNNLSCQQNTNHLHKDRWVRFLTSYYMTGLLDIKYFSQPIKYSQLSNCYEVYKLALQFLFRLPYESNEFKFSIQEYILSLHNNNYKVEIGDNKLMDNNNQQNEQKTEKKIIIPKLTNQDNCPFPWLVISLDWQIENKEQFEATATFSQHVSYSDFIVTFSNTDDEKVLPAQSSDQIAKFTYQDINNNFLSLSTNCALMFYGERDGFIMNFAGVQPESSDKIFWSNDKMLNDDFFKKINEQYPNTKFNAVIVTTNSNMKYFMKMRFKNLTYFLDTLNSVELNLEHPEILENAFLRNVIITKCEKYTNLKTIYTNFCTYQSQKCFPNLEKIKSLYDINPEWLTNNIEKNNPQYVDIRLGNYQQSIGIQLKKVCEKTSNIQFLNIQEDENVVILDQLSDVDDYQTIKQNDND